MEKQKKRMPSLGMPFLICALLMTLSGCAPTFNGNSVKNADTYALEIQAMNGTDQHTMELKEGDILQIQFETVVGSLSMEIKAPDGTDIYRGNGKEVTEFTIEITADGNYTFFVEGRKARGSIRADVRKGSAPETAEPETATGPEVRKPETTTEPEARKPETATEPEVREPETATGPEARDAAAVTVADLVGPWHLAEGENDDAAINGTFPGAMERPEKAGSHKEADI